MHRHLKTLIILAIVLVLAVLTLFACQPVEQPQLDKYPIIDNETNAGNKDHTTKAEAIDDAVGSLENLLVHLDSDTVYDTGYYLGADMSINTEDGSAFVLRLRANLYTYPYEVKDANGNVIFGEDGLPLVNEEALAIHNDKIRYSDIILEWFDGAANEMLIGFYFDGINPNSVDDGNDLYLNLQGSKRIFKDFGNSVLYQQLIRVITQFNLETVIGSTNEDGAGGAMTSLREALDLAITTNYKKTINGDDTTIFFNDVALSALAGTVTDFMQSIFAPFEDKLDPLTNKYLGFLFSTLGVAEFQSIDSDMEFIMTPNENLGTEILRQLVLDARGDSSVPVYNENTGLSTREIIPYQAHISAEYDVRVSANITFDKSGYTLYDYGNYEYTGDMYIPMLDLELDVLLRTDMNEVDNKINDVFLNCRDIATDDLIIGMYYENELTYLDIQGLQHLYGGIAFEDIGLPKAYKGGFNLADTLAWLFDFIDEYIVIAVDNILYGNRSEAEDSKYAELTSTIMNNITSTMKDEDDPSSRATIKIKIDIEMIRKILSITSETGVEYTTEQMILLINQQFNIDLESIAAILGVSLEELIDTTYFDITYDVDEYSIRLEVYSFAEMSKEDLDKYGPTLIMRMDLYPNHIGEYVRIVFPDFHDFKPLQDVMTYSGYLEGQFIFASTEEVDLSGLLSSFMGDQSGLNTPFILPDAADIYFTLYYDQYIREQILDNGRWTRSTRSAFNLYFYMVRDNVITPIIRVYANDVSFNTADPIEELGYIWLDYICLENMPKFKVREDIFIRGFYEYMGYDFENEDEDIVMGLTDIVQALMEDSWAVFEPDVIRLTTSNQTIKDLFRVDELIGTVAVQIGFKQRVKDIDQLEVNFAMYTVGEFDNIEGESVYSTKLHETVPVYFDFGTRIEKRDFFFLYNPDTINIINGETYYMPSINNLFMGVTRDYLVRITTDIGKQAINSLVEDYYVWEPLDPIPTRVQANYGDDNLRYNYDAEYRLHAVYDRNTGYYTVLNDLGYEIIYDFENNLYVVGLGTQPKYDKAIEEVLNKDVPYYYQNYENNAGLHLFYDLGMHKKGWYVVEHETYEILYNQDYNYYVVETELIRSELLENDFFGVPLEGEQPPKVYPRTFKSSGGYIFSFDLDSGRYCYKMDKGDGTYYIILYDYDQKYFFAQSAQDALALQTLIGETRVAYSQTVSFNYDFDYEGKNYGEIDFTNSMFQNFTWTDMEWEDLTLEGGKFVVYVIIGDGMMATYRENVVVKVLNRTIDTNKYVNIETPTGTVTAPVADSVTIDPYAYLIYKALYENTNLIPTQDRLSHFVEWYFKKYEVTFKFTKIYFDEEDTPDEVDFFSWQFDDNSRNSAIYKEIQINNIHSADINGVYQDSVTYVYTVFHGQVIALAVNVMPRMLDSAWIEGEDNRNEYTVDALEPDTFTIPTELVYFLVDGNGNEYVLNFADYYYTVDDIPSLFSTLPETFAPYAELMQNAGFGEVLAGPDALSIIKWNHPVANNVKLVDNDLTFPFLDVESNETKSFFDLANYFDLYRNWYYQDPDSDGWFFIENLVFEVNVPNKVIGTREYTFNTGTDFHEVTETVMNIQVKDYYTEGQTTVGENWGIFYVDPYDSSTWKLPNEIAVMFNGLQEGTFAPYFYTVAWRNVEGDATVHFDNATGEYYLSHVSKDAHYFILEADIGAGGNTMRVKILVQNMTGVTDDITFKMLSGELADGNKTVDGINYDGLTEGAALGTYQLKSYNWAVDTYSRFEIPEVLEIVFADGTTRTYLTDWHDHLPWKQGENVTITTTLGNAYALKQDIALTYSIEAKRVIGLTFNNLVNAIDSGNLNDTIVSVAATEQGFIELVGVTINPRGVITFNDGTTMNPYDFFNWLFSDITISFDDGKPQITVYDAASSALLPIFGTIDTQKLIEDWNDNYGQGVDIYIGQDDDAHDFTVRFMLKCVDANGDDCTPGIDFAEKQNQVIEYIVLDVYNADNTPKYPNGYVFSEQLQFKIERADGSTTVYGPGAAEIPQLWSVSFPSQEIEDAFWSDDTVRMAELTPYEQLTNISWERLALGGEIWVSAMLYDSSRIYFHIEAASYDIGSNYHSADDDTSDYDITYGTIVIDNLYDNYRLSRYLIPEKLPSKVKIGNPNSTLTKSGIIWEIIAQEETLNSIGYLGTKGMTADGKEDVIALAQANIMGKKVTLYLNVLPAEVVRLSYQNQNVAQSRRFTSELKDDNSDSQNYGYIVLNIDAYHNWAYNGVFVLANEMNVLYRDTLRNVDVNGDGVNEVYPHEFLYSGMYFFLEGTETQITEIGYGLNGHNLSVNGTSIPNTRDVKLYTTLADGQLLKILVHFLDKEVTAIQTENSTLTLDPYSENITVPNEVTIFFKEGTALNTTINWNVPENFEVKFDTFRRVLGSDTNNYFAFTSSLEGYVGLEAQDLLLKVKVRDRVFDEYQLVSGVQDTYVNYENPNAYYHYQDAFSGRASDLPSVIDSAYSGSIMYPLIWQFSDEQITANGTFDEDGNLTYITVYGHVYNVDRGQPVAIKVYVDKWEFRAVRRPDGNGGYIIMDGQSVRFIISAITGLSSFDHYMIDFEITSANPSGGVPNAMTRKMFIPEGIEPSSVDVAFDENYDYRLIWDQDALNYAKSQGSASGYYVLANGKKAQKFRLSPAEYQYERPHISQIDLGYGMGTQNNAIYVVNPLNPMLQEFTVKARGNYNTEYEVDYDNQGLVTTVVWNDGGNVPKLSDTMLAGGVIRNWKVLLELRHESDMETVIHYQNFEIVLVALDMSPTSYINNDVQSILTNASFKTNYNASTYAGANNPYKDLYLDYLIGTTVERDGITDNVLNTACRDYNLVGNRLTYVVESWDENVYISNNNKTRYSKKVNIAGRSYTTNMVRRVWNQAFAITELNLGNGMGADSYRVDNNLGENSSKIIKVLNPLIPVFGEQYASDPYVTKLDANNVVGTHNGQDISALGYTFTVTWWDRATNGNTVIFGDEYLTGGVIDYWKVKVSVYNGNSVIYEQIVNVMIILLDMSPTGDTVFFDKNDRELPTTVNKNYTSTTYEGVENPYGDAYSLYMSKLNDSVNTQIPSADYTFRVDEWSQDSTIIETEDNQSKEVRKSTVVTILVGGKEIATLESDLFTQQLPYVE